MIRAMSEFLSRFSRERGLLSRLVVEPWKVFGDAPVGNPPTTLIADSFVGIAGRTKSGLHRTHLRALKNRDSLRIPLCDTAVNWTAE